MPLLEIKHISHSYGSQAVVRDLSCALDQGAISVTPLRLDLTDHGLRQKLAHTFR